MKRIGIWAVAASPVAVGARSVYGQFIQSRGYIPGGTWRGAVAEALLRDCPQASQLPESPCDRSCPLQYEGLCYFRAIFVGPHPAIFTSLYPTAYSAQPVFPTPLSLHTCKHFPGSRSFQQFLRSQRAERTRALAADDAHGVFDLLRPPRPTKCPQCGAELTPVEEPFLALEESVNRLHLLSAQQTVQTHVAINRRRHTAQEHMLYSVQAIPRTIAPEKQREEGFTGFLLLPDELPEPVAEGLQRRLDGDLFYIGGGASRGLGAVQLSCREQPAWLTQEVKARLGALSTNSDGRVRFALWLTDDAILLDPETQAPRVGLSAEIVAARLAELTEEPGQLPKLTVVASYHRATIVSGWSTAWELPKFTALATVKGSCALFEAETTRGTPEGEALATALARLEEEGIGERRAEGFGQLIVSHPLHTGGFQDA